MQQGKPYRLEKLVHLVGNTSTILGYELLAGDSTCPSWDIRDWRSFYFGLVAEIPKILNKIEGLLFINLDGDQMLDADIYDIVLQFPATSKRLVLEWTEHHFRDQQTPDILARIVKFKKQGFQIAVDDIGSGVDGMGRAIACQPHYGKIDGSLLHHARKSDPETGYQFIAGMVKSLQSANIQVIMEMIESEHDLNIAKRTGANFGQGFLWKDKEAA